MSAYSRETESFIGSSSDPADSWDAKILHDTVREAIHTSPGSFLKTLQDVDETNWANEIRSSTWVVAECGEKAVGVAAAKRPNPASDREDRKTSRYIESVWIAPEFRRRGLAEQLISFLLEAEYRKDRHIEQFLLWVFEGNSPAISLYEHTGFALTQEKNQGERAEIKYRLDFNHAVRVALGRAADEVICQEDGRQHRVTYRVLEGKDSSQSSFRYLNALTMESKRSSFVR